VQQARRHQLAREFEAACAAYEELIRTYPHSSAVGTSHIALGQLKLEPLDRPAEALTHFEAYLARHPGGLLAEEASLGRIRALVRQGRHEAVIRAATGYLQQFPGSPASPEVLWVRAESLQATGDHSRAEDDHRELVSRWPDTPAARLAAQLLDPWTESP
jgi:TolA-binding protein